MSLFKKLVLLGLLLSISVLALAQTASSPKSDPSVEAFWTKFKAAVQKSDKASVAAMSQFPIEMSYGVPKIRNRTQLNRRWSELFKDQADAVKCFADAKPSMDDRNHFSIWCKDEGGNEVLRYFFARTRTGWKLLFLDNINE